MNIFKAIVLVIVMVIISSCNEQRSRSTAYSKNSNNGLTSLGATNYRTGTTPTDTSGRNPAGGTDTTGGRVDTTASLPPEVAHCKFALDTKTILEITSSTLGPLTVCKSKEDDRVIYVQFEREQTTRILIFPTYTAGTKSFYIGPPVYNIQEATLVSYKIYKYNFEEKRNGFKDYPINSVMLMKDEVNFYPYPFNGHYRNDEAYIACNNWVYHSNDSSYCNAFKAVGKYVNKVF
jgi:hypothetical protein